VVDERVQDAIRHWAGRFIANGVDYNDFISTTAAISSWEEWLDAWTVTARAHAELAERATAAGHSRTAGEAWLRAAVCFHFSKFVWTLDPALHERNTEAAVAAMYAAHALLDPTAERVEAPLGSGSIVANLRRPAGVRRAPLVVLVPGLDSAKEEFWFWESVFLDRGMATLSLDGPGQGETGLSSVIRPDYEVAVSAILDAVLDRPELNASRVGTVGVGLGGYYVVRVAAFEPRIRALAGVSGPFDFAAGWESLPVLTRDSFRFHSGARDEAHARELAAALNLESVASRVLAPCLVVTGKLDRVITWEETKRIADGVPGSDWVLFERGTHVCNNIPFKYRPLVADWMLARLSAAR
jgi:hypothetical protein